MGLQIDMNFMKGIELAVSFLFLTSVTSCEYRASSMEQAQLACDQWEKLGIKASGTVTIQPEQTQKMERAQDINTQYNPAYAENWLFVEEKRREWMSKPQTHEFTSLHSRECVLDKKTQYVLGKENKEIASGNFKWMDNEGEWEIVKRFAYHAL